MWTNLMRSRIASSHRKFQRYISTESGRGPPCALDVGQDIVSRKQLQDSIQQCCSQMAQMQQDVTDLKQRPTAFVNPKTAFDQQGPFHGYQYPAASEYPVQCGPYSMGQPGRSAGKLYPTAAVGPTPQLDYALGRGSQSHVTVSAERPSQRRTNQSGNVGAKDGNSSARSSHTGATPRRGELEQRGTT